MKNPPKIREFVILCNKALENHENWTLDCCLGYNLTHKISNVYVYNVSTFSDYKVMGISGFSLNLEESDYIYPSFQRIVNLLKPEYQKQEKNRIKKQEKELVKILTTENGV